MLRANNITKDYRLGKTVVHALKNVSLNVKKGEFLAIAGPSGSGKSTLLNIFGCLDRPNSGELWIDNTNVNSLSESKLDSVRLHTIGFIFQAFNLIPVLNVYENIELPLLIRKDVSTHERKKRVKYFMERVGLQDQRNQRPFDLSGGQCQRVAVARALATNPQIILADEPTANLDSRTGIEIIDLMHEMNTRELTTFIFSTHDHKILQKADRIIYLEDGTVKKEEKSESA